MIRGRFITFEGGEGAGKSTQVTLLADALRAAGFDVAVTREPGGAPGAEEIRKLLLHGDSFDWDPLTEALLHFAARRNHLEQTILPALDAGRWVISDRFADSTYAYQGYGHGVPLEVIDRLYTDAVGDFEPDVTVVLDIGAEAGLARAAQRNEAKDRYESMDLAYHERLRDGFLTIAAQNPGRCIVMDATRGVTELSKSIFAEISSRLRISTNGNVADG